MSTDYIELKSSGNLYSGGFKSLDHRTQFINDLLLKSKDLYEKRGPENLLFHIATDDIKYNCYDPYGTIDGCYTVQILLRDVNDKEVIDLIWTTLLNHISEPSFQIYPISHSRYSK